MPHHPTDIPQLRRPGLVKICGLREPAHALVAAEAGADLLSMIFAPSKRQVTVVQAAAIVNAVHIAYGEQAPVIAGGFVDESAATINEVASAVGLDLVQLNGPRVRTEPIHHPVIRSVSSPPGSTLESIIASIEIHRASDGIVALHLIDAYDPVYHGGTGKRADWRLARELALRVPLMLAGGLNPENVAEAIARVHPLGVDVSSGVETDGVKDPAKIRDFIANAKQAFAVQAAAPIAGTASH